MRTISIVLFILLLYNPSYVKGEDEKRILMNDPATIQSFLHQYETQLNKYGIALQQVESKMAVLEGENTKLKMENQIMNDSVTKIQRRIAALETNITSGTSVNNFCSFYVLLSHDLHLHKDAPVIFNDVRLNENNCYNNGDGVFVASIGGIYIFHWKITTHTGSTAGVLINRNGQNVGMLLLVKSYNSDTSSNGVVNHNSASEFAILRLQKGDHVHLSTSLDSFIHAGHSGFGGFYLRE